MLGYNRFEFQMPRKALRILFMFLMLFDLLSKGQKSSIMLTYKHFIKDVKAFQKYVNY